MGSLQSTGKIDNLCCSRQIRQLGACLRNCTVYQFSMTFANICSGLHPLLNIQNPANGRLACRPLQCAALTRTPACKVSCDRQRNQEFANGQFRQGSTQRLPGETRCCLSYHHCQFGFWHLYDYNLIYLECVASQYQHGANSTFLQYSIIPVIIIIPSKIYCRTLYTVEDSKRRLKRLSVG